MLVPVQPGRLGVAGQCRSLPKSTIGACTWRRASMRPGRTPPPGVCCRASPLRQQGRIYDNVDDVNNTSMYGYDNGSTPTEPSASAWAGAADARAAAAADALPASPSSRPGTEQQWNGAYSSSTAASSSDQQVGNSTGAAGDSSWQGAWDADPGAAAAAGPSYAAPPGSTWSWGARPGGRAEWGEMEEVGDWGEPVRARPLSWQDPQQPYSPEDVAGAAPYEDGAAAGEWPPEGDDQQRSWEAAYNSFVGDARGAAPPPPGGAGGEGAGAPPGAPSDITLISPRDAVSGWQGGDGGRV